MGKDKTQRRGSPLSLNSARRKVEFSKMLVVITGVLFVLSLFLVRGDVQEGYDTVSYTHLDVYKRQGLYRGYYCR